MLTVMIEQLVANTVCEMHLKWKPHCILWTEMQSTPKFLQETGALRKLALSCEADAVSPDAKQLPHTQQTIAVAPAVCTGRTSCFERRRAHPEGNSGIAAELPPLQGHGAAVGAKLLTAAVVPLDSPQTGRGVHRQVSERRDDSIPRHRDNLPAAVW